MATPAPPWVIAPLWKRGVASVLDSLPVSVVALPLTHASPGDGARRQRRRFLAALAFSGVYHVSLGATRGQTLGQRVVGIQVVDADTGAVPTSKQSAVRWAMAVVPEALSRLVPLSAKVATTLAAIEDLQPDIERLTQRHHGDRARLNEELMELFDKAHVDPADAYLPMLVRALPSLAITLALYLPALKAPWHQGVHDRVAGTVVVRASPSGSRPA